METVVRTFACLVPGRIPVELTVTTAHLLCLRHRGSLATLSFATSVPHELCAHVGQRTIYYPTDRRSGGCRMQWKIW